MDLKILELEDLDLKRKYLTEHYQVRLRERSCQTGRPSIITDGEFKDYVDIFVEYDMKYKKFPADHPQYPNMPMARTIRDYFDYSAKIHGFETYAEFAKWKYEEGPWKPSNTLWYMDVEYKKD